MERIDVLLMFVIPLFCYLERLRNNEEFLVLDYMGFG